jgi:hypothetical protein
MSKLGDRIRRTIRVEAAPIGFRAVRPQKNPQLLVAVQFDSDDTDKVPQAVEKGAGAVLLKNARGEDDVKAASQAAGEVPLGAWPKQVDAEAVAALVEAGADFLVFDAESTPACALLGEKLGYVLTLRGGQDENYLRVLESVVLDAVLIEDYAGPLTLQKQVELRLVAGLTRKPLMLPVKLPIEGDDLECLRDAGVSVLMIDGSDSKTVDELPSLLQAIEALPGPRRRRETSLEVLLPRAAELAGAEEEEEGEEGE